MGFQVQSAEHIVEVCTSLQSLHTRVAELDAPNSTEGRQVGTLVACDIINTPVLHEFLYMFMHSDIH